ncbi:MAG TPA: M1 family metallopeptidase [Longimicrobium sp.]|nr:M1 family metallopeptidase [Longimicrobium sp.]
MSPTLRRAAAASVLILAGAAHAGAQQTAAAGQTNRERMLGGVYGRQHDYDLVHQRIEVRDFDWDSTSFRGRVATTLVSRRAGMDSVVLDMGHLLRATSVTSPAGATLRHAEHGDTIVVFPARAAAMGDTVRFTIVYDGRVENGRGLTFIEPEGRPHRPRQIWSQGEAMDNHRWFPTYDFPNDKATWELVATVPGEYTAVSNGRLVSDTRNANGTRTQHWRMERPSATYLVSLVVAPLVKIHDTWRGRPVDYYVYREDSALARPLFRVTPDMMEVYSRLTGVDYPWSKYAQTTVADFFGGMENVSATTLVDWLPDARAYADRPWYPYILIPHELAHQWFGDYVTTQDWSHIWLNEGFAEFMPGQYWAQKLGARAEDEYYVDEYRQFMAIDARRRMPVAALGSNNIYPRGALVLKMLKDYLGPRRFWASVNRYLTNHALGTARTDDLRIAIRQATGEDLGWFFDQWVYQAGYPELTVTQRYDAAARRLTLQVQQTQQDTSTADSTGLRYTTPAVFRMPVTVRVGTAAGAVTRTFQLDRREQSLVINNVGEPRMVVFDVGNRILKKLTFQQPTAQLAEQLARDSALWNRQWVVQQLAQRKDDPAALAALTHAATRADHPLTRAQAATALGGFAAETSLPALQTALRDTSSAVRAAGAGALGLVRGARAGEMARAVFERDTSYQVRAAALTAAVRADTTSRAALIRRGIATPSYRDAIRGAALNAIATTGDTTFIAQVDALTLEAPTTVFTLAALARRGSADATTRLLAHLNDPSTTVRRNTVFAIQQVGPTIAQPLQAALPGIRDAETRAAVEEMLKSLPPRQQ